MYVSRENPREKQHFLIFCRVDWRLNPEHRQEHLKANPTRLQCHLPSYSSESPTLEPLAHN